MSWLSYLTKFARRRFKSDDSVRFFTERHKGTGKNIVLSPRFSRGKVVDYNSDKRRYLVDNNNGVVEVHPRNIVPEIQSTPSSQITERALPQ